MNYFILVSSLVLVSTIVAAVAFGFLAYSFRQLKESIDLKEDADQNLLRAIQDMRRAMGK